MSKKKIKGKAKEISVEVVYPVQFHIKVPKWYNPKDGDSVLNFKGEILDLADKLYDSSTIAPIIHEADLPELVD